MSYSLSRQNLFFDLEEEKHYHSDTSGDESGSSIQNDEYRIDGFQGYTLSSNNEDVQSDRSSRASSVGSGYGRRFINARKTQTAKRQRYVVNNLIEETIFLQEKRTPARIYDDNIKILCDICDNSELQHEAISFCVDCQDYLCVTCSTYHCKPRPMRHHRILDKDKMPKRKSTLATDICRNHKNEEITFYCSDQDKLGCNVCMVKTHKVCRDRHVLTSMLHDFPSRSSRYSKVKESIKKTAESYQLKMKQMGENLARSDDCNKAVIDNLRKERNDINKQFDKLEKEISYQTKQILDEDLDMLTKIDELCTTRLEEIEKMRADLSLLEKCKQHKKLYIAVTRCKIQLRNMVTELGESDTWRNTRTVALLPNELTKTLAVSEDALGHVRVTKGTFPADIVQRKISLPKCLMTTSGKIFVSDYSNKTVTLYSLTRKREDTVNLPTGPWDMTETTDCIYAVTLPHEKKIKLLIADEVIKDEGEIEVDGFCEGIGFANDNYVVTFTNPAAIKILQTSSEVIRDIEMFQNEQAIFLEPSFVAVDTKQNIYVTDPILQTVTQLTCDGSFSKVCKHNRMESPYRIYATPDDLWVCERGTWVVHRLTFDLSRVKIFRDEDAKGDMMLSVIRTNDYEVKIYALNGIVFEVDETRKEQGLGDAERREKPRALKKQEKQCSIS